jgi:ubiquinone/menaquinone biosynthesis C-methylase UbiE
MPSVGENHDAWNERYVWTDRGDEWSEQFGGTEALWWFVLYPRIHRFLPAETILEIAPGYGRWTQFLKAHCTKLIAVDLSAKCVEYCRRRFSADTHVEFHVNDGRSLTMVSDDSIDFTFSFDSLVHAEGEVMEGYLKGLSKKLKRGGSGFVHHSNMGAYPGRLSLLRYYERLPTLFRRLLPQDHLETALSMNVSGWRAKSMSAALFRKYCASAGLKCVTQELFSWFKGKCLIDAISVIIRDERHVEEAASRLENAEFIKNALTTSRLSQLYCGRKMEDERDEGGLRGNG